MGRMPLVPQRYRSVLASNPFRNFLAGSTVASVGSPMVQVAAAWLAPLPAPQASKA